MHLSIHCLQPRHQLRVQLGQFFALLGELIDVSLFVL